MKVKTSITLSQELIATIDAHRELYKTRSEFIEAAIRAFPSQLRHAAQNVKDAAILSRHADRLNREAMDVLAYPVDL